jgi:AraC family transcriptional regulator of adaptative response/methylated-DNA-[protein]-cysteine methyltransferase
MSSNGYIQLSQDYYRVEQAILYLEDNFRRQPSLKEIAASVHLSEYHFQRIFTRWAGISPKRFLQFLTLKYAKQLLAESQNLLDVTYEAGLSSPGRLHDLFVTYEAVTPGEYKSQGEGLEIIYGFHPCPFGECLLAVTERGICGLAFVPEDQRRQALERLIANWPQASFDENSVYTQPFIERIFDPASRQNGGEPLKLYLKGTNFQLKVWQALLQIPPGMVVSYDTVAALIGQPTASRAVGRAAAHNTIGFVIPCHRVIRKAGEIGDYAWDSTRKKAIIGWEAAQRYRDTVQDTVTDEKQPLTTA